MNWDWWHSLMRALTGRPDISINTDIPKTTDQAIRGLREQRYAADQQVRILRRIAKEPDPTAALRRAQTGFPLTRSLRPNTCHDA